MLNGFGFGFEIEKGGFDLDSCPHVGTHDAIEEEEEGF